MVNPENRPVRIKQPGPLSIVYEQHWHAELVHFPVSFFVGSALFMVLHLLSSSNRDAYELASFVMLVSGAVVTLPATLTGWLSWRKYYRGARTKLFLYKIRTAFAMVLLSITLVVWHVIWPPPRDTAWLYAYAVGIFLLFLGTVIEGYYGGRLNHH